MDSILISALLLGIPMGYIVKALLLQKRVSHEGPFKFKNFYIMFPDDGSMQKAALFDIIRFIGGAYRRDPTIVNAWIVHEERSERWTCPFCLSFWLSFLFSIPLILSYGATWIAVPVHFAICTVAVITAKKLDDN